MGRLRRPCPRPPLLGSRKGPYPFLFQSIFYSILDKCTVQKADSLDIVMILLGYVLMHITFFLLISRSRQLGSNFWLPTAIVSSSVLALILALPIAMTLRIPMDPVALTEALPFLVCTVGFDKPLRLARAVFTHPHLTTPHGAGGGGLISAGASPRSLSQLKPANSIITESLTKVAQPILR